MIAPPRRLGRRGSVLVYLGLVDLLIALSLWRPAPPSPQLPTVRFLIDVAPLAVWAALWAVVGVLCLAGALVRRLDRVAFTAATVIKTLWGGVFLVGWLAGVLPRGWVSSVTWLALAVLVMIIAGWAEPPETAPPRRRG